MCIEAYKATQTPMADRTLLQTREAEPENSELCRYHGKCRTRPNLDSCHNRLTADVYIKMFKAPMELLKPRQVLSVEPHDIERSDGMA